MRDSCFAALALSIVAASSAAFGAPRESGWIDPPNRPAHYPAGPLRVLGGVTPIASVNANDASGNAQLGEFSAVTIRGVVQVRTGALDPIDGSAASNWIYVADATGTVAVTQENLVSQAVAAGDSVEVSGFVFTRLEFQVLPGTRTVDAAIGTITILATGQPVLPAQPVTASQIASSGVSFEGSLVQVAGLTVVSPAEWPAPGSSAFVQVTDGSATFRILVDEDTDLDEISAPGGTFGVTGFVAQSDPTAPFLDGHIVYPRSRADISQGDGSGTAVVSPAAVGEGATGVSLAFTITGQAVTLETIQVEIPASWTWTSPGALSLSGPGFAAADSSVVQVGEGWLVTVTGAAVTAAATGTLALGSLTAPATVGSTTFVVRTATAGGTLAQILSSPIVQVVSTALPGDVVINELYPRTLSQTQGVERSEFIEIVNVASRDFVIEGWTLSDIGRTADCALGPRWAFPEGTTIPAGGFLVVCQTALDVPNNAGFLLDPDLSFPPGAQLFEMHDPSAEPSSADHAATPNMILLDPSAGDDQIVLLGGPNTNAGQCESPLSPGVLVPFEELVVLRSSLGDVIDAVEFREFGPCTTDMCGPDDPGGTGASDAYPFGPPNVAHTLGRDESSSDTGVSADDLRPSSSPSPGAPNDPHDRVPPAFTVPPANVAVSASILEVRFDEPVVDSLATDPAHYAITLGSGAGMRAVREVLRDPAEPLRHYFLVTEPLPAGADSVQLRIQGITDISFDGLPGNAIDATVTFPVPENAVSICAVQQFDEVGFSPFTGDTVTVAGYVTIAPSSSDRISIWVQEPGEEGCGANAFSFELTYSDFVAYGIRLNDLVRIRGRVTEFISTSSGAGSVTEIAAVSGVDFFRFLVRGLPGPAPRVVTTGAANDEALEGTLLRTEGTVINANSLAVFLDDGSGAVQVFQNFSAIDLTRFKIGDRVNVTGVITQFDSSEPYFSGYELVPQSQDALVLADGGFASSEPTVRVPKRVLVPSLGETMEIVVNTPRRSDVIVEIFDAIGRKVTTFYDGVGLGEMRFDWDGRGQDGDVVSPGVYLCHVRAVALDGGSVVSDSAPIVVGLRLDGGGLLHVSE